ncbi:hypothetical protein NX059_009671 [Plenodomus lindquistii]|nr:hypothetical protein NX059_009671 [Plenodomus lindquistii]
MVIPSLPTELRLEICAYAATFNLKSFLPYLSLYTSCHQVKREMDIEVLRILTLRLREINSNIHPGYGIQLEIPTACIKAMRDLRLMLSKHMCKLGYSTTMLRSPCCFDAVFESPVHSLTLVFDYT